MMAKEAFDMMEGSWRRFYQPITFVEISREQKKDEGIKKLQEQAPDQLGELFEDIGKMTGPDYVVTQQDPVDHRGRILVPANLTKKLMSWYHAMLIHPGGNRLYNTLRQHYTWRNMQHDVCQLVKTCDAWKRAKRGTRGMGKIPLKDIETEPWKDVAVDLAGPWVVTIDGEQVQFQTFTIIDVFSGWVEIIPISTKKMETIRDLFMREWVR